MKSKKPPPTHLLAVQITLVEEVLVGEVTTVCEQRQEGGWTVAQA